MAGIVHVNKNKKLLLALVFVAIIACFFCFPQRAKAELKQIYLVNNNPSLYQIRTENGNEFTDDYVYWDTDAPAQGGMGPFKFCIVYNKEKFAEATPLLKALGSGGISQPVELNPPNSPIHLDVAPFGEGEYKVYSISNLGEHAELTVSLFCEVALKPHATEPNTIFPTSHAIGQLVPYNQTYTFKVQVDKWFDPSTQSYEFYLCKVKSYNTDNNTENVQDLNYRSMNTNAGNNDKTEFTYVIDNVLQNTTVEVYDIVPAFLAVLPVVPAEKCELIPAAGTYMAELGKPFTFTMNFTAKYGDCIPHASLTSQNGENPKITWDKTGIGSTGGNIFKVSIDSPQKSTTLNISFNTNNWHIILKGVQIQTNSSYYAINPTNAYMQVEYDENAVFYIIPTAAYAHNTNYTPARNPVISVTSGYTATVENQGSQYKCTIYGLRHTVDVSINVSSWAADPNAPSGSVSIVTMPTGEGYSISNILGGYALGSNQYRVNNGADFSFSVNVLSGYDASTLNVSVAGQRLFPVNGVYTIPSVNANLTVTASVSKTGTSATPSPGGGGSTTSTSTGGGTGTSTGAADDGELKYREIYDEKLGIMISGFFVGVPKLKITDLLNSDPVYIRMLKSAGATEDKVLRAVDVQILNGTLYGTLTLGLHVGVGYNTIEMLVIHGTSRGDEKYKVLGRDGMASVGVRSTSPFMVVDPDGLGPGASSTGTTSIDSVDGVTIGPPRTGGAKNTMGFILLGIVAFSIVFIIWYRKRDA